MDANPRPYLAARAGPVLRPGIEPLPTGNCGPIGACQVDTRPVDYDGGADYLGITPRHLRELVARRAVPYIKVGRLIRFLPADLDAWLAENRVQATGAVHGVVKDAPPLTPNALTILQRTGFACREVPDGS